MTSVRLLLLAAGLAGCASAPAVRPPVATAGTSKGVSAAGGPCPVTFSEVPAKRAGVTRILITDFYDVSSGDGHFADSVANQVDIELGHLREEELPNMSVPISTTDIDAQRVRCFVNSHAEAERVAAAWKADLVIWGQAYYNKEPEHQRPVNIRSVTTIKGSVRAEGGSEIKIGTISVEARKPYTVSPSATLYRPDVSLRRSTKALDLDSLARLDLPTLSSTAPFQLVYFTIGLHFFEHGQPWIAARLFERSVEDLLDPRDPNLAVLYRYLGQAFLELPGGAQKSIDFSQTALKEVENTGSANEAVLRNNIGAALSFQGKTEEATKILDRANAIDEKVFGRDSEQVAVTLNNVGSALLNQARFDDALGYFKRALAIDTKREPPESLRVAMDQKHVGYVLIKQGKAAEALQYLERALPTLTRSLSKDHPAVAKTEGAIGQALYGLGKNDRALERIVGARLSLAKTLGPDHPDVAITTSDEGVVLLAKGDLQAALERFQHALKILEATNEFPFDRAATLTNIGSVFEAEGRKADAIEQWEKALAVEEEFLQEDNPVIGKNLSRIALALHEEGKDGEAAKYFKRAVGIAEMRLGPQDPSTKLLRGNLALCLATASGFVRGQGMGAVVIDFEPGSAAKEIGLEVGDWIVRYGKSRVVDATQFNLLQQSTSRGSVWLIVTRNGHRVRLHGRPGDLGVTLGD